MTKPLKSKVKIRQVGNSAVVSIPAAFREFGFQPGSSVWIESNADGSVALTPVDEMARRMVPRYPRPLGDVRVSPAGSRAERIADGYIQYTPEIAAYWDSYVDWDKRRAGEGDFFINVLKHHNVARVLDAACGTGYDSVRLLEAGFQVTSCDGSLFMLTKARINAEEHGLAIEARFCDWRRLARSYDETFDAVVFLGNSFSHLFEVRERLAVLRQIHTLLEADGVFIIDQRNYDLVLAHGFPDHHRYVYAGDGWHSQILEKTDDHLRCLYGRDAFRFEMDIYPIRVGEMVELLTQAGFVVETFGDFATHSKNADVEFFQHVCTKR